MLQTHFLEQRFRLVTALVHVQLALKHGDLDVFHRRSVDRK